MAVVFWPWHDGGRRLPELPAAHAICGSQRLPNNPD